MTSSRHILLTGATGFVGGAVLRRLLADGHRVVAIHGSREPMMRHDALEWRRVDLLRCSATQLGALIGDSGATHCLHAAWYTNHADYLTAPVNRDWLSASTRLVDAFYRAGGERFVGLGTCVEYDQQSTSPFKEDLTPLRPEHFYARCKLDLFGALRDFGGDHAWARIFYVYGAGDRGGRLVPYVIDNLSRGERAGARYGGLRRDYIQVDDLAHQLARILVGRAQGAVNTGTGAAVRVADIFRTAAGLFGRPDLVDVNDGIGPDQAVVIEADMTRFASEIGPVSTRSLHDGLAELVRAAK